MVPQFSKSPSIEDLIALNDEFAALAKAGVPFGEGLAGLGDDLPAGLARVSRLLAERMERGQTLPDALAAAGDQFPPMYRALVSAGIRSGRLPAAFEQLSESARRMAALRRMVARAMIYPAIVVGLAYGLFLFFIVRIAPVIYDSAPLATLEQPPRIVRAVASLRDGVEWWGPILPAVAATLLVLWWARSSRATMLEGPAAAPFLGVFKPMRRLIAESRAAGFAETLSLLVAQNVPLGEALPIAGEASGDPAVAGNARELAAKIASGAASANTAGAATQPSLDAAKQSSNSIPPMLLWLIATGDRQSNLATALRQLAEMYRRRAQARAEWLCWRLPTMLTIGLGGSATLIYALALFVPWTALLKQLSHT